MGARCDRVLFTPSAFLARSFREMLVLLDTCQAATLSEPLRSAGVIAMASSVRGENSYAYGHDTGACNVVMNGVSGLRRCAWQGHMALHREEATGHRISQYK